MKTYMCMTAMCRVMVYIDFEDSVKGCPSCSIVSTHESAYGKVVEE